ncbi:hypothetical protein FDB42_16130 [Clostridium botulinum]|uniref:hypothetical protein n=1 Tax=Clostridium botulinum TaxID=1491 RepID=UPI0014003E94|nr:hypothetical protein [Clostridium botulinum]MBY6915840.1 hypothetical protein [Clostridium botulinum]NFO41586.1 hypothetical protein [Clostridium botulinum]NFQ38624.1 hypothetical protein [Clostridium botulinum]
MDKRVDEKILDFINAAEERELRKDITNGLVKINNKFYEFKETEFFDGALKMYIPNTFEDMSMEARKLKYPSESRPEIIKCNEDGSIAITLNIIDSPLDESSVEELKNGMKMIIKKTNPANVFYEDGILEVDFKNIGFFEFKSSAIDDFLYNIMFFLEFEGKTLMGTFCCRYGEYKEWRDVIFEVLKKIEVIKKE